MAGMQRQPSCRFDGSENIRGNSASLFRWNKPVCIRRPQKGKRRFSMKTHGRKLIPITAIAIVAVIAIVIMNSPQTVAQGQGQGQPPGPNVTIVGPLPLPVTGETTTTVSGTVAVREVDNPARHSFQKVGRLLIPS